MMMMIPNIIMGINATSSSSSPSPSPPNPTTTTTTTTTTTSSSVPSSFPSSNPNKRKTRPAGTQDPDAELVSLSPKTLLESYRYVCEICNQGFQRDQNLQMHRQRHKVPWKLLKREGDIGDLAARKRVYVCPEPSCLHHDPGHALGDLVGIKKHFRRKHSDRRQWACDRCGKGYAVQSDYKAHLKTCGSRDLSCDYGRVFSRVENFIEHQDACNMGQLKSSSNNNENDSPQKLKPQCLSKTTASSPSPSRDTNNNNTKSPRTWRPPLPPLSLQPITFPKPNIFKSLALEKNAVTHTTMTDDLHNLDLQLSSSSPGPGTKIPTPTKRGERFFPPRSTRLLLSIGTCDAGIIEGVEKPSSLEDSVAAEKDYADEARRQARQQIKIAEKELSDAKRMRKLALAELEKARVIKEQAKNQIKSVVLEITCNDCKQRIQGKELAAPLAQEEKSLVWSYVSSAITEGEVDEHNGV